MPGFDPLTLRRAVRFAGEFRERRGRLATLRDFEEGGFPKALVERAVKERLLLELYVTLTNGAVAKGYKPAR